MCKQVWCRKTNALWIWRESSGGWEKEGRMEFGSVPSALRSFLKEESMKALVSSSIVFLSWSNWSMVVLQRAAWARSNASYGKFSIGATMLCTFCPTHPHPHQIGYLETLLIITTTTTTTTMCIVTEASIITNFTLLFPQTCSCISKWTWRGETYMYNGINPCHITSDCLQIRAQKV